MVLAHARALLVNTTPDGVTGYIDADYHDPGLIVADARNILNLDRPVGVLFMGVLGYVEEQAELLRILRTVLDAVPSGSHLVLWDGTNADAATREGADVLVQAGGAAYHLRSPAQLAEAFAGLELIEPGLVPITEWHPASVELGRIEPIDAHGAVARKP